MGRIQQAQGNQKCAAIKGYVAVNELPAEMFQGFSLLDYTLYQLLSTLDNSLCKVLHAWERTMALHHPVPDISGDSHAHNNHFKKYGSTS